MEELICDKDVQTMSRKELGREGERIAAHYLRHAGYKILARNWRCFAGEVDIIAEDDNSYVLVEVKTRFCPDAQAQLMPELAVSKKKQEKYRQLALLYLAYHTRLHSVRFDVIAINLFENHNAKLRHLCNAFWCDN